MLSALYTNTFQTQPFDSRLQRNPNPEADYRWIAVSSTPTSMVFNGCFIRDRRTFFYHKKSMAQRSMFFFQCATNGSVQIFSGQQKSWRHFSVQPAVVKHRPVPSADGPATSQRSGRLSWFREKATKVRKVCGWGTENHWPKMVVTFHKTNIAPTNGGFQ